MKSKLTTFGFPLLIIALILGLVLVAIFKTNAQQKDYAVAVTVPVELTAGGTVKGSTVGLLVTVGNENAEGSEWSKAAAGAQVAVERFNRTGSNITLLTEDDRGTASGAVEAVRSMAEKNVSGIVVATRGEHLKEAIFLAQQLNIPLIFPYDSPAAEGTWSFQPSSQDLTSLMAVQCAGKRLIRIDQEGFAGGVNFAADQVISLAATADIEKLAQDVAKQVADSKIPLAVVVNADPYLQAKIAQSFQDSGINAELILGPGATSPAFSVSYLSGERPRSAINALSLGYNSGDNVALQTDGKGRAMSAYLQMVKILGNSSKTPDFLRDQPFSDLATDADSRSHDAMVALVRAMERSPSLQAKDVKSTLQGLKLAPADGITLGSVDFSHQNVVQEQPNVLASKVGNLEMRTTSTGATVSVQWFPRA